MKLIAGLGNPGDKFKHNRHNVGFMVVDAFAKSRGLSWRYLSDLLSYVIKANNFVLVKPAIYMNKSGEAIHAVSKFYKINAREVLVVYDELDLEFGKARLSFNGSSAGHHGVESVIVSLGTMDFARLRVGIGKPSEDESNLPRSKEKKVIDHVLTDFSDEEIKDLAAVFKRSDEALQSFIDEGIEATMNRFN